MCCVQNLKAIWSNVHDVVGWQHLAASWTPAKFWQNSGGFP
jgi:hypothetical protein